MDHPQQTLSIVVDYAAQIAGLKLRYLTAHLQPTCASYAGNYVLDIVSIGCRLRLKVFGILGLLSPANSTAVVFVTLAAGLR